MRSLLTAIVIGAACGASTPALADNLEVSNIASKVVKGPDRSGDVWFAVRCLVKNKENRPVENWVTLQAIDHEGFQLEAVTLRVKLRANESKYVTEQSYMSERDYRKAKWQLKD